MRPFGTATPTEVAGRVLAKLGGRDRVQAVIFAYDLGLTRPGATEEQLTRTSPRGLP